MVHFWCYAGHCQASTAGNLVLEKKKYSHQTQSQRETVAALSAVVVARWPPLVQKLLQRPAPPRQRTTGKPLGKEVEDLGKNEVKQWDEPPKNMRRASLSSPSCSTGGAAASTYTQKDLVETLLQTVSRDSRFLSQRERKEIAVSAATWRVWEIVIKSLGTTSQSSPFHDIFPDSSRW